MTVDQTPENNQILNELLIEAVRPLPLHEVLGNCLDTLLRLSWLSLLPKAGIMLAEKDANGADVLRLVAERNLGEPILELCNQVSFGHCLCGRAALSKSSIHAECVDARHENTFDGMSDHGHYNIPMISNNQVFGVIVFYLPHGTKRCDGSVEFLERAADTLALVVSLHRQSAALSEKVLELDYQKRALDEHAIVTVTDVKGSITYANDKFCEISGYQRDELIGSNHRLIKSDEHSEAFFKNLWRTISSGKVWRGEIKNRRKNGKFYWLSATIVPFLDARGKPHKYVAIRTDITAEREKEAALKKATVAAEAANTAKSEFLAAMSHEIRTPMTAVMGFADLLLDDDLPQLSKNKIFNIKDATRSLMKIINDILDISKLEAGMVELEYLDTDLTALFSDVFGMFQQSRLGECPTDIEFYLRLAPELSVGAHVDPTRLRQILVNLVGNAVKFTASGSVTLEGTLIATETDNPQMRIAVRDTGIGIAPDKIATLFDNFTQADASISRRFEGTGLGLSICRKLIHNMDGEIGVNSQLDQGSEFWFTLPYRPADRSMPTKDQSTIANSIGIASKPLQILVVDDNQLNQKIISAMVGSLGHSWTVAENGADAVAMHRQGAFDLILMDIRMPVMSGTEATRVIRQMNGAQSTIPIIAVTADAMEDHRPQYFDAGMNAVVTKPIDRVELAVTINETMGEAIHKTEALATGASIWQAASANDDSPPDEAAEAAVADFLDQIFETD